MNLQDLGVCRIFGVSSVFTEKPLRRQAHLSSIITEGLFFKSDRLLVFVYNEPVGT